MLKGIENSYSKEYMYMHVHSSTIHNSQKVETTQMSITWWMDKQMVVYPHCGILLSRKKESHTDTCYNMEELQKHTNKRSQAEKMIQCIMPFMWNHIKWNELSRIGKSIETDWDWWYLGLGKGDSGEKLLNGWEVLLWHNGNFLDRVADCITLWMY